MTSTKSPDGGQPPSINGISTASTPAPGSFKPPTSGSDAANPVFPDQESLVTPPSNGAILGPNPEVMAKLEAGTHIAGQLPYMDARPSRPHGSSYPDGENLIDLGETNDGPKPPPDAGPPDPILSERVELPPPPVPPIILSIVEANTEAGASSLATAMAAVLAAINLLVAEQFQCQSLARLPHPLSLYIVVSSESGWKKSAALNGAFQAHIQEDTYSDSVWREALKEFRRSKDEEPRKVSDTSPVALRDNITIAALLRVLFRGRRTQGLVQSEAASLFAGHSFTVGRVESMAGLVKLWDGQASTFDRVRDDGVGFRLAEQCLTAFLVGTPAVVDKVVFSEDAANGFGPRLLYSADTKRPDRLTFQWADGCSADKVLEWFGKTVGAIRHNQDHGRELLDYEELPRTTIGPTAAARALLEGFYAECEALSDSAESPHERGFWIRAPEQAARIAATFAGWQALQKPVNNPEYDAAELVPAIELTRWYAQIIRLRGVAAAAERDATAAAALSRQLIDITPESHPKLFSKGLLKARTFVGQYASKEAAYLRGDLVAKERVLEILVRHRWLEEMPYKGLFQKNPAIGQAD